MKAVFLALACLIITASGLFTQTLPPSLKPQVGITIFSDGKPVNQKTGIKAATKKFRFKALLNTKVDDFFNDFKPELLIDNTQVLLTRNGRKIAQINTPDGQSVNNLMQSAQPTDNVAFIFTLVAQRKNGELVSLSEQPTYTFSVRE